MEEVSGSGASDAMAEDWLINDPVPPVSRTVSSF
jgi:hypothetical protein